MGKKLINRFSDKISLIRLSGISKIFFVDIHRHYYKIILLKRKESFFTIMSTKSIKKFTTLYSNAAKHNGNFLVIFSEIKKQADKFGIKNPQVIFGINEFRLKTVTIASDVDEIETWFDENTQKFLVEGQSRDNFQYSYSLYKKDDEYFYYNVIICRKELIDQLIELSSKNNLKILSISPFSISIQSAITERQNILFLDFTEDRLSYSFCDENNNIIFGEKFKNLYLAGDDAELLDWRKINFDVLNEVLSELKHNLTTIADQKVEENLNVFIVAKKHNFESIVLAISVNFSSFTINSGFENYDPFYIGTYLVYDSIIKNFDNQINLLDHSQKDSNRFEIDKQSAQRFVIVTGIIIILFLLVFYWMEDMLNSSLQDGEEELIESQLKKDLQDKLLLENQNLRSNLSNLLSLKNNKAEYSKLFYSISELITENVCFISLDIKETNDNILFLDFVGVAYDQEDVTILMKNLEQDDNYKDVKLIYTSTIETKDIKENKPKNREQLTKFNLTANYYAHKK
ncbi:MAG: PilN domain-containing protein [Ignavibacteriales bacterium]|nr:PilN domain-containing protein [Ignavibacteriales bacterium]